MRAWLTVCFDSCAHKCTKRVSVRVDVTEVSLIEGPGSRVDVTQVHVGWNANTTHSVLIANDCCIYPYGNNCRTCKFQNRKEAARSLRSYSITGFNRIPAHHLAKQATSHQQLPYWLYDFTIVHIRIIPKHANNNSYMDLPINSSACTRFEMQAERSALCAQGAESFNVGL